MKYYFREPRVIYAPFSHIVNICSIFSYSHKHMKHVHGAWLMILNCDRYYLDYLYDCILPLYHVRKCNE